VLILPIEEIKPGMKLAAPVTHPEHPDQDLLKAGYVLEDKVVARLRELGIACVYVDYPGLDDLDRHLAANLSPARQKLYSQIKDTIVAGQKRTRPAVQYTDYYANTRELVLTLMSQGQHPVYIESMTRMGDDAVTHAAAVAHLGLLLGIKLEMYLIAQRKRLPAHHAKEVVNIGVAGMLHDMGKLQIPESLRKYNGVNPPEKPDEIDAWQEHTNAGYEMVRGGVEPSAAAAVLHHHQHWDGSGFPATQYNDGTRAYPNEERIHIFARIVAVANLYDRVATSGEHGQRRSNLEVLHLMRSRYASWCDPTVLKVLQSICPPFPPGQIVTLSDATTAVVVDMDQNDPYRPIVKRLAGEDRHVEEARIELKKPGSPAITHVGGVPVEGMIPPTAPANAKLNAA
jgi:HD-GYP domain-containing protein (c-di-GMP phosphodiesterase class II)